MTWKPFILKRQLFKVIFCQGHQQYLCLFAVLYLLQNGGGELFYSDGGDDPPKRSSWGCPGSTSSLSALISLWGRDERLLVWNVANSEAGRSSWRLSPKPIAENSGNDAWELGRRPGKNGVCFLTQLVSKLHRGIGVGQVNLRVTWYSHKPYAARPTVCYFMQYISRQGVTNIDNHIPEGLPWYHYIKFCLACGKGQRCSDQGLASQLSWSKYRLASLQKKASSPQSQKVGRILWKGRKKVGGMKKMCTLKYNETEMWQTLLSFRHYNKTYSQSLNIILE